MRDDRDPLDEDKICAFFASRPDSGGFSEAEFQAVLADLLARGIVCRAPYRTPDGTLRYRIERAGLLTAFGAFGRA